MDYVLVKIYDRVNVMIDSFRSCMSMTLSVDSDGVRIFGWVEGAPIEGTNRFCSGDFYSVQI